MRLLTSEESALIRSRRARFDDFLAERLDVLKDFVERLVLPDAPMVVVDAARYLPAIDAWMKQQIISPDDRIWIHTRIGYFIGEYLVQTLGGYWFVEDTPDARFFGRYVVGNFSKPRVPNLRVDPFHVADVYLNEGPGRRLSSFLAEVVNDVSRAGE
ncbi:MAG TPA: hypothetical protein VJ783_01425 [Pirellulales bacterium]|nr:hypothetical protein [Pirellulales bacterium]